MNIKEIEDLLELYFEGKTSLEEEQVLRDFFKSGSVPEHLHHFQPLFKFIAAEKNVGNPIDANLLTSLEHNGYTEAKNITNVPGSRKRSRIYFITSMAAVSLLMIGLVFTFRNDIFNRKQNAFEKQELNIAFYDTREALMLLSSTFNMGLDEAGKLQKFDMVVSKVQIFNKFYQFQPLVINPDEMSDLATKPN